MNKIERFFLAFALSAACGSHIPHPSFGDAIGMMLVTLLFTIPFYFALRLACGKAKE